MLQKVALHTRLQLLQDPRAVRAGAPHAGRLPGARGRRAPGFESPVQRREEGHQLPQAGHGALAQERESALRGDVVRAADFLAKSSTKEKTT